MNIDVGTMIKFVGSIEAKLLYLPSMLKCPHRLLRSRVGLLVLLPVNMGNKDMVKNRFQLNNLLQNRAKKDVMTSKGLVNLIYSD